MNYEIIAVPKFKKELKKLSKRYPSLKRDFSNLIDSLAANPEQGTAIGKKCFKIRLSIKSKGRGKSGGARVITHIVISQNTVYLLAIYDKSDKESISDTEVKNLLKLIQD